MINRDLSIGRALRASQRGFLLNPFRYGGGGGGSNPHLDKLKVLLHFDGLDGATTTVDSSPVGRAVTLANSAQLDDAQKQFGATSCLFTNASQSYLSMAGSADFDVGTADFTIRFWARKSSNGAAGAFRRLFQTAMGDVVCGLSLADNRTNGNLSWSISTNGTTQNIRGDLDLGTFALNTWVHFSIEQFGGSLMVYVGGVRKDAVSMGGMKPYFNGSWPWTIGGQTGANRTLDGWVDEFEYYKGVALAGGAASYTPPTAPSLPA